jgi:Gas vesicle protein
MTEQSNSMVTRTPSLMGTRAQPAQNLADVLERVLDKGIVIVGDIQVRLLDIELLTIKIRLMVASVERAQEMGINWWEGDPFVSTLAQRDDQAGGPDQLDGGRQSGRDGEPGLRQRVEALEQRVGERDERR